MSLEDVERMLYKQKNKKRTPLKKKEKEGEKNEKVGWRDQEFQEDSFFSKGSNLDTGKVEHIGKKVLIVLLIIFCIGLGFAGYYLYQYFSGYDIGVELVVPQEVRVGEPFIAEVLIKNNSQRELYTSQVSLSLPRDITSIQYPQRKVITFPQETLGKEQSVRKELEIVAQGSPYTTQEIEAGISYKYGESVFSNTFERGSKKTIAVKESLVGMDVGIPQSVLVGEEFEIHLRYYNTKNESIENVEIVYTFPRNFSPQGSSPSLQQENMMVSRLDPNESKVAIVTGFLENSEGEGEEIGVEIWRRIGGARILIAEKKQFVAIAPSPLFVQIESSPSSDKALSAGDRVRYSVIVSNTSAEDIYDIVLRAILSSDTFDLSKYSDEGYVSDRDGTITWRGSDIPWLSRLGPGESQTLSFTLPLRQSFSQENVNQSAQMSIEATSPTVPFGVVGEQIEGRALSVHTIGGVIGMQQRIYAQSIIDDIETSGPTPPRQGEQTTYLVVFSPQVQGAAFERAIVRADLSAGVEWTGHITIEGTNSAPQYNQQTKRITWDIGTIPPGDSPLLFFQIALTPSQSMIGGTPQLLRNIEIEGRDSFTQQLKRLTFKPLTLRDIEDKNNFGVDYYRVLP